MQHRCSQLLHGRKDRLWWLRVNKIIWVSFLICMTLFYCLSTLRLDFSSPQFPVPHSCAPQLRKHSATSSQQHNNKTCVPKMDIMFLKTHKTGSSTFLNILFRFAEQHKLKFAFPNNQNDFYYPSSFQRTYVHSYRSGKCFNVICNHMRFNSAEVAKVLPRDTFYVTILRDPAELFESSFHYFSSITPLTWRIPGEDKMAEFLRNPNLYFSPDKINSFYLKNLIFFDLGGDNTLHPDDPRVEESIRLISGNFHLVMLMEHFEESLILFKDIFCWEMDDILFFKLNSRNKSAVSKLSLELRAKALQWNSVDWKLYKHFNRSFWEKVEAYGRERMERDVAELRRRNAEMAKICIDGPQSVAAGSIQDNAMQPWQPFGEKFIVGYNLNKNIDEANQKLCRKMLTQEIQYLKDLGANVWFINILRQVRYIINW